MKHGRHFENRQAQYSSLEEIKARFGDNISDTAQLIILGKVPACSTKTK